MKLRMAKAEFRKKVKRAKTARSQYRVSPLEERFDIQIRALRLPLPQIEYRFHDTRRWRFDYAWPERRLAVEIEGGTWVRGRHSRGAGMRSDAEKYNTASLMGWTVLRFTGDMVKDGSALDTVKKALQGAQEARS